VRVAETQSMVPNNVVSLVSYIEDVVKKEIRRGDCIQGWSLFNERSFAII